MNNKNRARQISSFSPLPSLVGTGAGIPGSAATPSDFAASVMSVSGLPLHGLHKSALREACDLAGGQKSLAARIGTTQSMVWYWLVRSKRGVPGEFVLAVEAVTGISRHALRPDIFPEPDPKKWEPVFGSDQAQTITETNRSTETDASPGVASHSTAEDCR